MCCGGFGGGGGGGGGGNLLGTLTPDHIPYASGIHTLSDSSLIVDPLTGDVSTANNITVGADIILDASTGQIDCEFLDVHSSAVIEGLLTLKDGFTVDPGTGSVFSVDTSGNTIAAGTMDIKGQLTYEKSTVKKIVTPVPAGGGPWTVAIDVSLADIFFVGSGAGGTNTEISNPTNVTVAAGFVQTLVIRIESSANAADTFSLGTAYHFAGGVDPLLAVDWSIAGYYYLGFIYNENAVQWDYVGTLVGPIT